MKSSTLESPSNPTIRAVKILNFLSANPLESFGLSELARRLGMNKATCLSVGRTLVAYGYLVQNEETKTYGLGPALAAVGNAANERFPVMEHANAILKKLSREAGCGAMATVLVGDQQLVIGRHGIPDPLNSISRIGLTVPLMPPFGACFVAWSSPAELGRWLEMVDTPKAADDSNAHRELVSSIRSRGFEIYRDSKLSRRLQNALNNSGRDPESEVIKNEINNTMQVLSDSDYFVREINDETVYPVMGISSPVLNAEGRTEIVLGIHGFRWELTGREIKAKADCLMSAVKETTEAIGGYLPPYQGG